jgi:hypothetical protein
MTPEIRRAALRMAAKTALILSVGCGGSPPPAPVQNTTPAVPAPVVEACEPYLGKLAVVKREELADDDPLRQRNDVYGAFADAVARQSARTQQCCQEELDAKRAQAAHRWACCSALPQGAQNGAACTPWGPPCPPEMA